MKTAKPMSFARLAELVDAYGADPERWPAHEREPALALMASDPKAAELQRQAVLLDRQLDQFEVPDASAQLRARVLEIPIRRAEPERRRMWLPGWAIAAFALVPCALGFIGGSMSSETDDGWNDVAQLAQLGDFSEDEWPRSNIPKPFAIGLAVSIALNLFFLGIWAGRHWSGRDNDPYGLGVHGFLRRSGLNDAGPSVQQILHSERTAIRERLHDMGEARRKVREALDAEPFDRARLEAALADVQTQTANAQQRMHATLVKIAGSVDAQHRARMANALWPKRGFGQRGP